MKLARGQRAKLSDLGLAEVPFAIELQLATGSLVVDVACFGLDASRTLSDERYMTFFNQPHTPCGAVKWAPGRFLVELARLPTSIDSLTVTLAIDGPGSMSALANCRAVLSKAGETIATYPFTGANFGAERAVMLFELYRKDGQWRVCAVGQGFNGGLDALVRHFGGKVSEPAPAAAVRPAQPVVAPAQEAPKPKVSLTKITLTKPDEKHKVSLAKGADAPTKIVVKAVWIDNGDGMDNDDLDLRAGILLPDGRMAMVTAPDRPGHLDAFPFLHHMGDVTGASASEPGTEIVEVNPRIGELLHGPVAIVFSVYSALQNGTVSVQSLQPKMQMIYGDQLIECAFDFKTKSRYGAKKNIYTYVIGIAEIDKDSITLTPSGLTSEPDSEATPWLLRKRGFGFGLGTERLTVSMDGPHVFKGEFDQQFDPTNQNRVYL